MTDTTFGRPDDVLAALANPDLIAPPVEPGPVGTMAWLRATIARFSTGAEHARRRALLEADLARLDPAELRIAVGASGDDDARHRVVGTLAAALGLAEPDAVARAIATVAGVYFGGDDPAADAAVAWLLPRVSTSNDPEVAANRICLLVQAADATATLAERARSSTEDIGARLAVTLREHPPAPILRRIAARDTTVAGVTVPAGGTVLLDIAAANRTGPTLSFGAGPHACPAAEHALALAAGLVEESTMDEVPETDDRDPGAVITAMVSHVLTLAETWPNWDGRPCPIDDRVYTPHKAIRRVTDHLLDHLAELEARLAGDEPRPDDWHASASLTPADLAPFTPADLDEARNRLTRLADLWRQRLAALTPHQLDHSPGRGRGWTFRQLAFHLEGATYYADAVGPLPAA